MDPASKYVTQISLDSTQTSPPPAPGSPAAMQLKLNMPTGQPTNMPSGKPTQDPAKAEAERKKAVASTIEDQIEDQIKQIDMQKKTLQTAIINIEIVL